MGFVETRVAQLRKRYARAIISASDDILGVYNIAGNPLFFRGTFIVTKIYQKEKGYVFMIEKVRLRPYYKALPFMRFMNELENYFGMKRDEMRFVWF